MPVVYGAASDAAERINRTSEAPARAMGTC